MQVTEENVIEAFEQLETIAQLHYGKTVSEYDEAIGAFTEYLGMSPEARTQLRESLLAFVPEVRKDARPWVMIGFLIGMTAARYGLGQE